MSEQESTTVPLMKLRPKGQSTLPDAVRKAARLSEGDYLEVSVEDGTIVMRPKKLIDADQAWFWAEDCQKGARSQRGNRRRSSAAYPDRRRVHRVARLTSGRAVVRADLPERARLGSPRRSRSANGSAAPYKRFDAISRRASSGRACDVKGIQGTDDIIEMTWAPDGRATFEYGRLQGSSAHVNWRRIGRHDVYRHRDDPMNGSCRGGRPRPPSSVASRGSRFGSA